jgi:hypothetical protein
MVAPEELHRRRARRGYRRLIIYGSGLAISRLEREARKRAIAPDVLAARILEILGDEDMYRAVLDD